MRPKFLKFKRNWNAAEEFVIGINKSKKLQNAMKVDKIIIQHDPLLLKSANFRFIH